MNIYDMKLHEVITVAERHECATVVILRVPNGWVYGWGATSAFVPFSKEFQPKEEKATKRFKFVKPTLAQVAEYAKEIKFDLEPQQFLDYYDANGWRAGKNPMKDWKAAIRTWKRGRGSNDVSPGKKKTVNPKIAFEATLNQIILGWQNSLDQDGYIEALWDKYKDVPKYKNWHVVNLAKVRIDEMA